MSHFIRVLIGEWRFKLRIPKLFVSSFSLTPKTVKLINTSKRLWMVEMEKEEEDPKALYFKKNWDKFVKDNTLEAADFLIFKFDGKSTFEVVICGKSACDKMLEGQAKADMNHEDDETWTSDSYEDEEEDDEEYEESDKSHHIGEGSNLGSMPPSFTVQLLASTKRCVPTKFFKEYMRNEKHEVELETGKGAWKVTLLTHKKRRSTFARFTRGWTAFAQSHRLKLQNFSVFVWNVTRILYFWVSTKCTYTLSKKTTTSKENATEDFKINTEDEDLDEALKRRHGEEGISEHKAQQLQSPWEERSDISSHRAYLTLFMAYETLMCLD
ncbi:hypothetical protein K1719_017825 [Acacia pycnantha]|nr:hypothetical protein K1719_017825 [Acacia pycnantha]